MKLIFITLFLTFTLSNCFLRVPEVSELANQQKCSSNIEAFWTGYFKYWGLEKPSELLQCFNGWSASLFFANIRELNALLQDAENRNVLLVHLDWVKLALTGKGLESTYICINKTQDFQNVLKALGVEDHSEYIGYAKYVFYQANYGWLSRHFSPIVDALNNGDYGCAGGLNAKLMNQSAWWFRKTGWSLNVLKGWWNGVHIALGVPDAKNVLCCWNNETAKIKLELTYGLAKAVAEGNASDAAWNTKKWFNETGRELMEKIPDSTWECYANSTDAKWESEALGLNVTSKAFYQKMGEFVKNNQEVYWKFETAIYKNLKELNLLHAGSVYGNFLKAVAHSK